MPFKAYKSLDFQVVIITVSTYRIAPSLYTSFMAATKRGSERKLGMAP